MATRYSPTGMPPSKLSPARGRWAGTFTRRPACSPAARTAKSLNSMFRVSPPRRRMCSSARRLRELGAAAPGAGPAVVRRYFCRRCRIAWLQRDTLLDWIGGGPEPVTAIAPPTDPRSFAVAVDSAALIEACRRALIDYPPWLPAWRIESLTCAARFADPELAALRPELAGRAVMLARWRLAPGHAEPLHRQLAEQHLSRWYAASVVDARAWAVLPLAPVLRIVETEPPLFLALRRAVDRELGLRWGADRLRHAAHKAAGPSGSAIPARCRALPIYSARPPASLVSRSPRWISVLTGDGACMVAP